MTNTEQYVFKSIYKVDNESICSQLRALCLNCFICVFIQTVRWIKKIPGSTHVFTFIVSVPYERFFLFLFKTRYLTAMLLTTFVKVQTYRGVI